jgi:hypothetical protein
MEVLMQKVLAGVLIALAALSVLLLLSRYRAKASERRMRNMMLQAGLDPDQEPMLGHEQLIQAIRRRCRKCDEVRQCESWLTGLADGGNDFCPNARIFDILVRNKRKDS